MLFHQAEPHFTKDFKLKFDGKYIMLEIDFEMVKRFL